MLCSILCSYDLIIWGKRCDIVFFICSNMVPVPFIILYLKKLASFLAGKSRTASKLLEILFKRAKEKAGPVQEFQWLGLMLFVAVPFPGTGAWTGAIIASILDMPFWSAVSSNFCGVVLAGLLVNLLVNLGLREAIVAGVALFFVSTFMWSVMRKIRKSIRPTLPWIGFWWWARTEFFTYCYLFLLTVSNVQVIFGSFIPYWYSDDIYK